MNRYHWLRPILIVTFVLMAFSSTTPLTRAQDVSKIKYGETPLAARESSSSGDVGDVTNTAEDSICTGVKTPTSKRTPNKVKKWDAPDQIIEDGVQYCAILVTENGRIVIELFPKSAPENVNSFIFLAVNGFYDGVVWHRVIPDFVAQTGDPTGKPTGVGDPGYNVKLEIDPDVKYDREGRVGMARANDPNSAGGQFFITYGPLPSLDPHSKDLPDSDGYTIIGQVIEGMDVVKQLTPYESDKASGATPDKLIEVRVVQFKPKK